ncbi:MAG: right-handed parallel beta-helix repeat-containing protein, partial [Verrucomicrobiota bacterium]
MTLPIYLFTAGITYLSLSLAALAVTYNVDAVNGVDTSAGTGTGANAWKTIGRVNTKIPTLAAGDNVCFNRGQTFPGTLNVSKSGTSSLPITFKSYGSGNRPVITGITTLTDGTNNGWSDKGGGVWEKNCSAGSTLNTVIVNGNLQAMGRWPNADAGNRGYKNFTSFFWQEDPGWLGHGWISDSTTSIPNFYNSTSRPGTVVIRKWDWVMDRCTITGQPNANTINFNSPTASPLQHNGYGYFIQNHPNTLDSFGEWYYDPTAAKLRVAFAGYSPAVASVQVATSERLVNITASYVTFDNLTLRGADGDGFHVDSGRTKVRIENCDVDLIGDKAIDVESGSYLTVSACNLTNCLNYGIRANANDHALITGNTISNIGMLAGMGGDGNVSMTGIEVDMQAGNGTYNTIQNNTLTNIGYVGIHFLGAYNVVQNNFVDHFSQTLSDASGIGTWNFITGVMGRKILNNIVLNGYGPSEGTYNSVPGGANGIYNDDLSGNVEISGNTCANNNGAGVFLHNAADIQVTNNLFYNNQVSVILARDGGGNGFDNIRRIQMTGNSLVAKTADQLHLQANGINNDTHLFFSNNDWNYFVSPFEEDGKISVAPNGSERAILNLANWTASATDGSHTNEPHSKGSPVRIPPYSVSAVIGNNLVSNGSFTSNLDGASVECCGNTSSGSSGQLDGQAMQVTPNGGYNQIIRADVDCGQLTAGKKYRIRASILGSEASKAMGVLLSSNDNYLPISKERFVALTNKRSEIEIVVDCTRTIPGHIVFTVNNQNGPFWIDNVDVREVIATYTDPNSFVRFEYNNTNSNKTVVLSGNYVDTTGAVYAGSITLAPWKSAVLMKGNGLNQKKYNLSSAPPSSLPNFDALTPIWT